MVDLIKIQAIHDWARSNSVTDVQNFVSFAGYYKRFVVVFSTIVARWIQLTLLDVPFKRSVVLKAEELLTTAYVFTLPIKDDDLSAYCDTSNVIFIVL